MDLAVMAMIMKTSVAIALLMGGVTFLLETIYEKRTRPVGKDIIWVVSLMIAFMSLLQIVAVTADSFIEGATVAFVAIVMIDQVWGLTDSVNSVNKKEKIAFRTNGGKN